VIDIYVSAGLLGSCFSTHNPTPEEAKYYVQWLEELTRRILEFKRPCRCVCGTERYVDPFSSPAAVSEGE
jgi:hypothetical protein